jgi:hypothetical protein
VASHRWRQPGNRRWVHDDQNPKCDDRECERHIEGGPGGQERSQAPAAITTAPAAKDPCDRYNPYTATPTNAHTARYDPTNNGTAHTRPLT